MTPQRKIRIGGGLTLALILLASALWVVVASEARTELRALPLSAAFAPDGDIVFISAQEAGSISVLSLARNRQTDRFSVDGTVDAMVFHPDGRTAYVLSHVGDSVNVQVIDAARRRAVSSIPIAGCRAQGMAISADGGALSLASVTPSTSCMVRVDTRTRVASMVFSGHLYDHVFNGALAPDASRMYIVKRLYDNLDIHRATYAIEVRPASGRPTPHDIALGGAGPAYLLASPDNTTLAFSHGNGPNEHAAIRLIDMADGARSRDIVLENETSFSQMRFSADGTKLFALSGPEIVIIDAQQRRAVGAIARQKAPLDMFVSPDGSKIVVAEYDDHDLDLDLDRPPSRVGVVTVIDAHAKTAAATVQLNGSPAHMFWVLADRFAAYLPGSHKRHPLILTCP